MARHQQALAAVILKDPAVESLSSFIGIDGTNTTLNTGRIQINLKPLSERKISASDIIRRLQPEVAKVDGISLFMQPVQDLTVEDRVSRTEFQYSLEDVDSVELAKWAPLFMEKLSAIPDVRDVASDQLNQGSRPAWSSTATPLLGSEFYPLKLITLCTTPSGSAKSRPSLPSSTNIASSWK